MLCNECPKRNHCNKLCDEAETYANQDNGNWQESPISVYTHGEELRVYDPVSGRDQFLLAPIEKQILNALAYGLTRTEIAKKLNISMLNLRVRLQTMRKKALSYLP